MSDHFSISFLGGHVFTSVQSFYFPKRTPSQPVSPGQPNIDNDALGTKKLLLNTQVSVDFSH